MTSPRTPRQGDRVIARQFGRADQTVEGIYEPPTSPVDEPATVRTDDGLRLYILDVVEVLPETPEPPREDEFKLPGDNGRERLIYDEAADAYVPVPASQSVPAVPVSSTGGKETGEAAETATEALNAAGVGSLSEAIGLALNDTYAGLEFEDPTFERGTMAIMAVLRERLAGWRPPLPGSETEWGWDPDSEFPGDVIVAVDEAAARERAGAARGRLLMQRRAPGPWIEVTS